MGNNVDVVGGAVVDVGIVVVVVVPRNDEEGESDVCPSLAQKIFSNYTTGANANTVELNVCDYWCGTGRRIICIKTDRIEYGSCILNPIIAHACKFKVHVISSTRDGVPYLCHCQSC